MKLFRGLETTDYEDILRAVGQMLDECGYRNFRLVEHDEGVLVLFGPSGAGQRR